MLESGIPETHAGVNKLHFFVLRELPVALRQMSLRSFENDVIRPYALARGEPRIHFALNCSARSCPQLPRKPFSAERLDAELQRETLAFLARADSFRIDDANRSVWLSEILDFYREDYVPARATSLIAYANRYAARPAPLGYTLLFTPYDWRIANSRADPAR
ncbi:MAG: DUF547 domain-containing protein [Rubrivivax sp.]